MTRASPPMGMERRIGVGYVSTYGRPDSTRIQFWVSGDHGSTTAYLSADEARKLGLELLNAADEFPMPVEPRAAA